MPLLCFYMSHTFDLINDKKKKKQWKYLHLKILLLGNKLPCLSSKSFFILAQHLANLKRKQSETIWSGDKPENDRTHSQRVKIRRAHSDSYTGKFMVPWYFDYEDILPKKLLLMIKDAQATEKEKTSQGT